jgi:hypothetical protein
VGGKRPEVGVDSGNNLDKRDALNILACFDFILS